MGSSEVTIAFVEWKETEMKKPISICNGLFTTTMERQHGRWVDKTVFCKFVICLK